MYRYQTIFLPSLSIDIEILCHEMLSLAKSKSLCEIDPRSFQFFYAAICNTTMGFLAIVFTNRLILMRRYEVTNFCGVDVLRDIT